MDSPLKRAARLLAARPAIAAIIAVALSYALCELVMLALGTRGFGTDEFRHLEQLKAITTRVPYADVDVVKTLVGLYVQAPLYYLVDSSWLVVCAMKLQLALAITAAALWIGIDLERWLGAAAGICGVALFVSMPEVIERGTEIRVDMLSALAGSIALLMLASERWRAAGIWLGLALLCTQKAAYFAVATGGSLTALTIADWRGDRRATLRAAATVIGWSAAMVLAYVAVFAVIAGPGEVWNDLVVRALEWGEMSGERAGIYKNLDRFWWASLRGHWGLYGLAAAGVAVSVWRARSSRPHLILAAFVPVFMLLCLRHAEPWHYFMVMPAPVLAISGAVAIAEIARRASSARAKALLIAGFAGYTALVPGRTVPRNLGYTNSYQRYNIETAERLLGPGDTYLDGVGMITKRTHVAIPELAWLDKMYLRRVRRLDDARAAQILESLERAPPLIVVQNYRTRALPGWLRDHIKRNYVHLTGALAIYGPRFAPGARVIARGGRYRLRSKQPALINGVRVAPGGIVELEAGPLTVESGGAIRLITATRVALDRRFARRKRVFRQYRR